MLIERVGAGKGMSNISSYFAGWVSVWFWPSIGCGLTYLLLHYLFIFKLVCRLLALPSMAPARLKFPCSVLVAIFTTSSLFLKREAN